MFDVSCLLDALSIVPDTDFDADIPEDYDCNDLDGVEDGVFIGDDDDLEELAEAGQLDGTEHFDAANIVRDIGMRNDFLASIGYDSLPEGWEVHHIIPLSEGGLDDPSNMVLIEKTDHSTVTSLHSNFYDWGKTR